MKKSFIVIMISAICAMSCKKEKTTASNNTSSTPINTTTGNTNNNALPVLTSTPSNGFLSTNNYIQINPTFSYSTLEAQVSFNKTSVDYPNGDFLPVKNLSLNGESLSLLYDTNQVPMYYWKGNLTDNSKQSWEVTGANGIPSFSFYSNLAAPFADFSKIPDTLKLSNPTFVINSLSNATSASLLLSAYGQSGQNIQVSLGAGNNKAQISLEDLKKIGTSKGLSLFISIENAMYKNFEGKNFKFSKTLSYDRQIIVVP